MDAQPNDSDLELRDRPDKERGGIEKRYTLRLSPEAAETLEWIARERGGVSAAEVIRRALGTERFLLEQKRDGNAILVELANGRQRELILR